MLVRHPGALFLALDNGMATTSSLFTASQASLSQGGLCSSPNQGTLILTASQNIANLPVPALLAIELCTSCCSGVHSCPSCALAGPHLFLFPVVFPVISAVPVKEQAPNKCLTSA